MRGQHSFRNSVQPGLGSLAHHSHGCETLSIARSALGGISEQIGTDVADERYRFDRVASFEEEYYGSF